MSEITGTTAPFFLMEDAVDIATDSWSFDLEWVIAFEVDAENGDAIKKAIAASNMKEELKNHTEVGAVGRFWLKAKNDDEIHISVEWVEDEEGENTLAVMEFIDAPTDPKTNPECYFKTVPCSFDEMMTAQKAS